MILTRLGESDAAIASVTVSLTYLCFVVADRYLHVSGVVSVVMAALTVAAYGPTHLHPRQWAALRQVWAQLEFWANCLIFVLASMLAANVLLKITWLYVWAVLAVAVGAFTARALVVFGMLPMLEAVKLVQPVNKQYKAILVWGGLRGAVTIVLAMVAAGDERLPEHIRDFIALSAVLFVLFTLFVNATTLGLVMHALGLDKLSLLELAMRDRVLALCRVNVAHHLQQIMRQQNERTGSIAVDPASAGEAGDRGGTRRSGTTAGGAGEDRPGDALDPREGALPRTVRAADPVAPHGGRAGGAGRPVDRHGARQGRRGLRRNGSKKSPIPIAAFRMALWLHRRFGLGQMLTERLADRFELLMVSASVLGELSAFNLTSVSDLLEPRRRGAPWPR